MPLLLRFDVMIYRIGDGHLHSHSIVSPTLALAHTVTNVCNNYEICPSFSFLLLSSFFLLSLYDIVLPISIIRDRCVVLSLVVVRTPP